METMEKMKQMESELKEKVAKTNPDHEEGPVATAIEQQTAKLPSDTFLWAALGSMAASLTLKMMKRDETALFVGQWAPSFLLLGIYNKLVKQQGHDKKDASTNLIAGKSSSKIYNQDSDNL